MNKTIWIVLIALVVVGGTVYLASRTPSTPEVASNTENNDNTNKESVPQGRVVFSVTDAAANMSNISEVNMKVNSVELHSMTTGWVTVSSTPRVYSLLALNTSGNSELLADITAKADTYDQVRLMIDSIAIKTKAGATLDAKLPSKELKINTALVVNADATSSVNFDFLASKSLHTSSTNDYIFAPVVKTETRSDTAVSISPTNVVVITGGKIDNTNTAGMDVDGTVKLNFQIKADQKLDISTNNLIQIGK